MNDPRDPRDPRAAPDLSPLDGPLTTSGNTPGATPGELDSDAPSSRRKLSQLADERVVHGLLRTLPASSRPATDRRVSAAIELLPAERGSIGRPRSAQGPAGTARPHRSRFLHGVARVLPAVALVAIALFLARFATQSPPAAAQPLDPIEAVVRDHVKAGEKAGPRRYALLIERDTPRGLMPMRGTVDLAPSGARRPDGTALRGNRFKVRLGPPGRPALQGFGFDGELYWHVPVEGPIRVGRDKSLIDDRAEFRGLVPWLTVERALQLLPSKESEHERGRRLPPLYQLQITDLEGGLRRFTLRRDANVPLRRPMLALRPNEVIFEARTSDNVVVRLDAYWQDDAEGQTVHPGRVKHLHFELVVDQVPPPGWEWFSHRSMATGEREVQHEG